MSPAPKITTFAIPLRLSLSHQDREFVQWIIVKQGNKAGKGCFAVMKKEPCVRIVEIGSHKLRVRVFSQNIKSKSPSADPVYLVQCAKHKLLPLGFGRVQFDVEDSAGNRVVGLCHQTFIADESNLVFSAMQFSRCS